jgi:hypothetical protein
MPKHAHLTSSHLVPRKVDYLSVNSDLVPTSSRQFRKFTFDLVPPRPKNHAHFDLVPLRPKCGTRSNRPFAHDLVPRPPVSRQGTGRSGVGIKR